MSSACTALILKSCMQGETLSSVLWDVKTSDIGWKSRHRRHDVSQFANFKVKKKSLNENALISTHTESTNVKGFQPPVVMMTWHLYMDYEKQKILHFIEMQEIEFGIILFLFQLKSARFTSSQHLLK